MAEALSRDKLVMRGVRIAGYAALALAMVFLARTLAQLDIAGIAARLSVGDWIFVAALSLAYGGLLAILAFAWMGLSKQDGKARWGDALSVYAPGVFAKYIPGSVFQYASRQVLGVRHGLGQKAMAIASLQEAMLHVVAATFIAAILAGTQSIFAVAAVALTGLTGASFVTNSLGRAALLQVAFFAAFGIICSISAGPVLGVTNPTLLSGLFLLAWIAGFLVPVVPGGIGVREAVLLALAGPFEATAPVVLFAVLTRLITLLGDVAFGLAGYGLSERRRWKRQASA